MFSKTTELLYKATGEPLGFVRMGTSAGITSYVNPYSCPPDYISVRYESIQRSFMFGYQRNGTGRES
ncbi:MAG: hypothetical protein EOO61_14020 [Hymenobacter sp.]|nr:MAG: hypothetical protein EOO61_14020 [Hymenobacter sp.]